MPIAGEFVSETFDYDPGRRVTVYVPPDPPEGILFAGDGQMISQWGVILEGTDLPPTMIVGAHRVANETLRLHEYSPKFDPNRFAAHERFFVGDVGAWVRSRFGVALRPTAPPSLVLRQAVGWRWQLAFAMPTSTARSSQPRPAADPGRPTCCQAHRLGRTSW